MSSCARHKHCSVWRVSLKLYSTVADFVGFTAYARSHSQEPDRGERLLFPGVLTNAGGAYDSSTSSFTCPVTAHYYFYYSLWILVDDSYYNHCYIDVIMDGAHVITVSHYSSTYSSTTYCQCLIHVVTAITA